LAGIPGNLWHPSRMAFDLWQGDSGGIGITSADYQFYEATRIRCPRTETSLRPKSNIVKA
jgi:hypothetical protein